MKRIALFIATVLFSVSLTAQLESVFHEVYYVTDGTIVNYPYDHTTYRVYASLQDSDDLVSAVFAAGGADLYLGSDDNQMWNSAFGSITGDGLNAAFFAAFPEVEYDSMVTIGRASSNDPGNPITAVSLLPTDAVIADSFGPPTSGFFSSPGLSMEDGAWFSTPDGINTMGTGADNRVLLAQLTVFGDLAYNLNLQVHDGGFGGTVVQYTWEPSLETDVLAPELGLVYPYGACCDATACNYDAGADPSACDSEICEFSSCAGCTDPDACNFDAEASLDNGSCTTDCPGCTDPAADNYDASATTDDGSCSIAGCTDSTACNYNAAATADNGTCNFDCYGCTDPTACNYDLEATMDNGMCIETCYGCTDPGAINYDPIATVDDGSCVDDYSVVLELVETIDEVSADGEDLIGWSTWRMYVICENETDQVSAVFGESMDPLHITTTGSFFQSPFGGVLASQVNPALEAVFPSLGYDSWLTIGMENSTDEGVVSIVGDGVAAFQVGGDLVFDDAVGGLWYALSDQPNGIAGDDYKVLLGQFTTAGQIDYCVNVQIFAEGDSSNELMLNFCGNSFASGCTDPSACNYNGLATEDDGSCLWICEGCTDATADNYDANATDDDGSCLYLGCTDATACNYDASANGSDGSCEFGTCAGCMDAEACNYDALATLDGLDCCYDNCVSVAFGAGASPSDLASVTVSDAFGATVFNFTVSGLAASEPLCLADGCYSILTSSLSSDGSIELSDATGLLASISADGISAFNLGGGTCAFGCDDAASCNFDPSALVNDGSCDYSCLGCTDPDSDNYDASATVDDGSCISTDYEMLFEQYMVHEGETEDGMDLTGYVTWRLYLHCPNTDDELSAIYGVDGEENLEISTTTDFFQSDFGGATAENINPGFFDFIPSSEYDSWLTIGKENSLDEGDVFTAFAIGNTDSFEDGGDLFIDDGAVFSLAGSSNAVAGDDNKVLVAQLTTSGSISYCMLAQIFINGDQSDPLQVQFCGASAGCTDPASCNYNPNALEDDGSCTSLCPGCTDNTAANYDADATVEDGSCEYLGCTDVSACNFDAGANVDDASCSFSCFGCTAPSACNYAADATTDDGSCCYQNCATLLMTDAFGDGWNGAEYIVSTTDNAIDAVAVGTLADGSEGEAALCLEDGCYFISVGEGDFPAEIDWSLHIEGALMVSGGGDNAWHLFFVGESDCEAGCMDVDADNYDPEATISFGCLYYGCADEDASNYEETANSNDGSCIYELDGYVFYDGNSNGVFDEVGFDFGLGYQNVTLMPDNITVITDNEGYYTFGEIGAGAYEVWVDNLGSSYPINTTPQAVDLTIESLEETSDINFGLADDAAISSICVDFYPFVWGYPCNGIEVLHNICFRNMGNETLSGIVEVEYDALFDGHVEVTPISSAVGNVVQMEFENLMPGEMFFYDIILITPSLDFMGETLTSTAVVYSEDEDGEIQAYGEQEMAMEVTCAYDPNDKMVFPAGYEEPHFVDPEQELEYVIRFQNTGNDTAQVVVVTDVLDANLDYSSFQLMASSHDVLTTIDNETGEISFLFDNILLPDSNVNEPESHGLVSYIIKPLEDLPHGTLIENTAEIYFDTNPAIVTNTTWNTIYQCDESMLSVNEGPGAICLGETVDLSGYGEYIEGFAWNMDLGVLADATFTPTESGLYEVILTANNPLCMDMDTVFIQVYDLIEVMDFDEVDGLLEATTASSWQWLLNGNPIDGATAQTYQITETGEYSVIGYTAEGCATTSEAELVTVSSILEWTSGAVSLFPNPTTNGAWLELSGTDVQNVVVLDARGRVVAQLGTPTGSRIWIETQQLASGMYLVQVRSKSGAQKQLPLVVE